jgi:hypothetical protein
VVICVKIHLGAKLFQIRNQALALSSSSSITDNGGDHAVLIDSLKDNIDRTGDWNCDHHAYDSPYVSPKNQRYDHHDWCEIQFVAHQFGFHKVAEEQFVSYQQEDHSDQPESQSILKEANGDRKQGGED